MIKNVLLIEDDETHAELLSIIFEENFKNLVLTRTTSALAATEEISKATFDLFILDLSLPDFHGLDFLDYVDDNFPRPPVIIITGDSSDETEFKAKMRGVDAYFIKPYDFSALIMTIKLILIEY